MNDVSGYDPMSPPSFKVSMTLCMQYIKINRRYRVGNENAAILKIQQYTTECSFVQVHHMRTYNISLRNTQRSRDSEGQQLRIPRERTHTYFYRDIEHQWLSVDSVLPENSSWKVRNIAGSNCKG